MPLHEKVDTIYRTTHSANHCKRPTGIRGYTVNFYRRFIPVAAQLMLPLLEALTGKPKALTWNEDVTKAFRDTKRTLVEATLLTHPRDVSYHRRIGSCGRSSAAAVDKWYLGVL